MPAPLAAKGLIISLSLLIAAGLAVYENPQFREWVDESRRKIALALHSFGDDIQPGNNSNRPSYSRSSSAGSDDASTREDDSPEAAERRRLARQEILNRARVMEERRRSNAAEAKRRRGASFDDMVDTEGRLRAKREREAAAVTSATESAVLDEKEGLRNRTAAAAALGAAMANPFADEAGMDVDNVWDEKSTAEAPAPPADESTPREMESTATLSPTFAAPPPPPALTINTDTTSTHPSELLVDLTPTTSAAPSTFALGNNTDVATPTTSEPIDTEAHHFGTMSDYQSVHEWAEEAAAAAASTSSFYSPPESEAQRTAPTSKVQSPSASSAPSIIGSAEHISGDDFSEDVLSEADDMHSESGTGARAVNSNRAAAIMTPDSWTEVGSVVSSEGGYE